MASKSTTTGDSQFSFAKIAAMPAPPNPHSSTAHDESGISQPAEGSACSAAFAPDASSTHPHTLNTSKQESVSSDAGVDDLGRTVQEIDINLQKDPEGSRSLPNGQENGLLKRENSFDDDRTHLSNSSTKMTNFDSKSLVSVTTFAMDEKDSVRPDDSASVQAIDEEESLSGIASGAPNSVTGSEAGGRAFRDHFRDNNALRPRGILPAPGPLFSAGNQRVPGAIPPDSVSNNFVIPASTGNLSDGQSLHGFPLEPDEKLLEAMKTPKDRLLILQLEEKIRYFIRDSSEQSLELPPSNAFGRLLAHKLGDYYHLTHFVDNNVTSVRLHRTPFCRLPAPLSAIHAANNTTPPPSVPAMKIMRRNEGDRPSTEGSVGASSSVPSKAPSEAGDSGPDGDRAGSSAGATPAKDRLTLTREEREAKYQEVRERIFRDFPESAKSDTASGDSNPNISRSSSTTGRKKNNKQRTPHDDSFEVRSQFNAYYPGYNNGPVSYNTSVSDNPSSNQVPYLVGPGVSPPTGGYMSPGPNGVLYPGNMGMNNMSQYPMAVSPQMASNGSWQGGSMPQQSPYSGYASINQSGMMSQQPPSKSSPAMNNYAIPQPPQYSQAPSWNTQPYPTNYQQPPPQRNQPPVHWPNYPAQSMTPNMAAYPYAQYPGQHLDAALQNQSANPTMSGNFARSHFNPQTRSFVPGGVSSARHLSKGAQPPMAPYGNMPPSVPSQWTGYPDTLHNRSMDHSSAISPARVSNANTRDSIAKWGTPSHLPPKPPPSEVPSDFDLKHRSGSTAIPNPPSFTSNGIPVSRNGPLVVSGGSSVSKTN
ncbi:uncharacterized protein N7459_003637 [Penicillium hispanicum]|uniref:uncharacterized protein n=1 Tax=Penicillium hispanicum TaxID=1080232 RepID=UPI0025419FFB|nr:uncharacterized protein N7459_003637 [Penicillium hispanicum]KAJ5587872.1 hypothetical protein N7459_003637 [Penicillium hispanicum]